MVTYNPEAEAAIDQAQAEAAPIREQIEKLLLDNVTKQRNLIASNSWQTGATPPFDAMQNHGRDILDNSPTGTKTFFENELKALTDKSTQIFTFNQTLGNMLNIVTVGQLKIAEIKKQENPTVTREQVSALTVLLDQTKTFVDNLNGAQSETPNFAEVEDKYATLQANVRKDLPSELAADVLKPRDFEQIQKVEDAAAAAQAGPVNQFSASRSWETVKTFFLSYYMTVIYLTLGFMGACLAANDMIERPSMYRVIFFIYGFILGPITCLYYFIRWLSGYKTPKIINLLPVTTIDPKDGLLRLFTYPFRYKEDGYICRTQQAYLAKAAETVGATYTPDKVCPPVSTIFTAVAANLEKLKAPPS